MEKPAAAEKPADTKAKPAAGKNKKKKPLPSFLGDDDDDDASPAPATAAETPPAADAAAAAAATAAVATEAGAAPGADEALRLSIQSMSAETVELKLTVEPEGAVVANADLNPNPKHPEG